MKTNNVKPKENNSTKPPLPFASLFIIVLLGIMAFIAIFFGTKDLGSVVITLALFWLAIPLLWIVSAVNMLSILYRDAYKSRQKRWGRLYTYAA